MKIINFVVFCSFGANKLSSIEENILNSFIESIRKVYAGRAKLHLLTDEYLSDSIILGKFDSISRKNIDPRMLLLERTRMYKEFIANSEVGDLIGLIDYDVLILRPIDEIFKIKADMYVTTRPYLKDMPINGGVLFIDLSRKHLVEKFYEHVNSIFEKLPTEQQAWWGDQQSLYQAAVQGAIIQNNSSIMSSSGCLINLIPREKYNYTPYDVDSGRKISDKLDAVEIENIKKAFIVHFKGPRKHLIQEVINQNVT